MAAVAIVICVLDVVICAIGAFSLKQTSNGMAIVSETYDV